MSVTEKMDYFDRILTSTAIFTNKQRAMILEVIKSYPNKPGAPHRGQPGRRGGSLSRAGSMERTLAENEYEDDPDESANNLGMFNSKRISLKGDGRAIAKPAPNLAVLQRFGLKERDSLEYEVKTYELSKDLGLDGLVPPTIERDGMSVQQWKEGCSTLNMFNLVNGSQLRSSTKIRNSFGDMAFLDIVSANLDRHGANIIVDGEENVFAIDNGLAFHFTNENPERYVRNMTLSENALFRTSTKAKIKKMFNNYTYRKSVSDKYGLDDGKLKDRIGWLINRFKL